MATELCSLPLPAPTRDTASALRNLREFGVCVIPDALTPTQLARAKEAIYRAADDDRARGRQQHGFGLDRDDGNVRVWNLLNRDPLFSVDISSPFFCLSVAPMGVLIFCSRAKTTETFIHKRGALFSFYEPPVLES